MTIFYFNLKLIQKYENYNEDMNVDKPIKCEQLYKVLYNGYISNRLYRMANTLKILILREDFNAFIDEILTSHTKLSRTDVQSRVKKYVDGLIQTRHFEDKSATYKKYFYIITNRIIKAIVTDYKSDGVNPKNKVLINQKDNYPNIDHFTFNRKIFWRIFFSAFFGRPLDPTITTDDVWKTVRKGSPFTKDLEKQGYKPDPPKIGLLTFDDQTEKQELVDYIQNNWFFIEHSLKAMRPTRKVKKRMTSSSTFLRDIDIFNKYQILKENGVKNPDLALASLLEEGGEKFEANTVRKIVSQLRSEIKNIN